MRIEKFVGMYWVVLPDGKVKSFTTRKDAEKYRLEHKEE